MLYYCNNPQVYVSSLTVFVIFFLKFHSLCFLQLKDLLKWYTGEFKDPMMLDPPYWFKSFILSEALLQLPFFPVAAYAFLKGQSTVGTGRDYYPYDTVI